MKRITVNLEDDIAKKLKFAAVLAEKTMKDYLSDLISNTVGTIKVSKETE